MRDPDLQFGIESGLPEQLVAGRGNALFVHGWCASPGRAIKGLDLSLGGEWQPALAHSVRRSDLAEGGGFWGIVTTPRRLAPARLPLRLRAHLSGGETAEAVVAEIEVLPVAAANWTANAAPPDEPGWPLVAVVMPTYEPKLELLEAQIESLRAQTHGAWYCLVCDDGSSPGAVEAIEGAIEGDERFRLLRHENRLGFYRNTERALSYVPREPALVALCDQDDSWHPDKLATLVEALGDDQLVYADMRVVEHGGGELSPSYWAAVGRRNEHRDLSTLLVSNTVTGAAALFRRSLLASILPFPSAPGPVFHDQWIGLVALAEGGIGYVDRPLQDYVQHGDNVTTNVELGWREDPAKVFANDVAQRAILATVLEMRCARVMSGEKRRAASRFAHAAEGLRGLAGLRALGWSRARRETTGGLEHNLLEGLRWQRRALRGRVNGSGGPLPVVDQYGRDATIAPSEH